VKVARPPEPVTQDAGVSDSSFAQSRKTLARVLTISALNGWGVSVVAAIGTLLSLAFADWVGAVVGALVLSAGWTEIRGNRQLKAADAGGLRRLMNAQMITLAVILIYCVLQLQFFDPTEVIARITPEMEAVFAQRGLSRDDLPEFIRFVFSVTYMAVGLTSILYQGGLLAYYFFSRHRVAEALAKPPVL
jgi:hypothetical protein